MGATTFSTLVTWVISHGYPLFFVAAFFEGPVVTIAAGIAAALGYYNIYLIILISVLGDVSADVVYYGIGYWGRKALINKYGSYIGLTKERVEKIESFLKRHIAKTMIVVKLSPIIPVPGLLVIGSTRIPLKKYAIISILITFPKSILFALVGFFSGKAYEHLSGFVANSQLIFLGIVILGGLVYFGYKKMAEYFTRKLEGRSHPPLV